MAEAFQHVVKYVYYCLLLHVLFALLWLAPDNCTAMHRAYSNWSSYCVYKNCFLTSSFYHDTSQTRRAIQWYSQRFESPVQSPQSWPPVHRHLFLGRWIACRLALSWGGRRCRPWPVCALHRWSWSPHRHTSASTASRHSLLHSVSGAGAEIGSYWFIKTDTTVNTQTNSVWTVNFHTLVAIHTPPYHTFWINYFTAKTVLSSYLQLEFFKAKYLPTNLLITREQWSFHALTKRSGYL